MGNKKILTLCMVHQSSRILLGMKKRGFGAGRWNGFGGKLAEGETIEQAAVRELKEEAGITVQNLEEVGIIDFEFVVPGGSADTGTALEVHIFRIEKFSGEPQESEEMKPQWFDEKDIPFDRMWPDDIHWLPLFLAGKKFRGKFIFGADDIILEKELKETSEL